jgi:hypothetical protein
MIALVAHDAAAHAETTADVPCGTMVVARRSAPDRSSIIARGGTPQERQSAYDAAWAAHPLRDHARFRLARPDERVNGTTLVFVGRSTWIPAAMRTPQA